MPLRKGIADIKRRAEISHKVTERYLEAHAAIQTDQTLGKLSDPLCQHVKFRGQRIRGLNPFRKDDFDLISIISAGEFCIQGLRNKDLRIRLFGDTKDQVLNRRRSCVITRKLRMLRAHGLIRKVSRSHRYMVTTKGRTALVALLAARNASSKKLTELAA